MKSVRWLGILLVAAGAHAAACNGRSTTQTSDASDGGEPSRGGRGGAGSTGRGGNEPAGGVAGTAAAGRGGTSIGRGGTSAGRGGTSAGQGNTGGTAGSPDDDCSCDGPDGEFSCAVPIEEFCYGRSAWGCPLELDLVRADLGTTCPADGEDGRYSECAGGYVVVSWMEGGENDYELVFDSTTGELVGGLAMGYVGNEDCDYGQVRAGVRPGSCTPTCRFCREFGDDGLGGEGGGSGLPRCDFAP